MAIRVRKFKLSKYNEFKKMIHFGDKLNPTLPQWNKEGKTLSKLIPTLPQWNKEGKTLSKLIPTLPQWNKEGKTLSRLWMKDLLASDSGDVTCQFQDTVMVSSNKASVVVLGGLRYIDCTCLDF